MVLLLKRMQLCCRGLCMCGNQSRLNSNHSSCLTYRMPYTTMSKCSYEWQYPIGTPYSGKHTTAADQPLQATNTATDVVELSLIFQKPLIYGLYLRVMPLTGIDHR